MTYDRIAVTAGMYDLQGLVPQGADLDDRFTLICDDTGETLRVNGWLVSDVKVIARGVSQ